MINNKIQQANPLFSRRFLSKVVLWLYQGCKQAVKKPDFFLMLIISRFKPVPFADFFLHKSPVLQKDETIPSVFDKLNVDDVVKSLNQDGFHLGINLKNSLIEELIEFAISTDCYGNGEYQLGFPYFEKEKAEEKCEKILFRGDYFNSSLLCPAIKTIASDSKLLEISAKYLGGEPVLTGSRLWWLFSVNEQNQGLLLEDMRFLSLKENPREGAYFFHYDLDDYQFLKFFFYLTDVDLSSGAHVCVRSSHKKKKLAHLLSIFRRRSEQDIIDYYGADNVVPICGSAGFGFAEDTFCFHKATPPNLKDRLMLQINFALNDYGNRNDLVEPALLNKCL